MIKTIVVPTDGSDHANKAIDLAADLACRYSTRMVILHVLLRHTPATDIKAICEKLAPPDALLSKLEELENAKYDTPAVSYAPVPVPVPQVVLKEVGYLIADSARQAAQAKGVKEIAVQVVDGAPADCILAAVQHEGADMVVMGSRGLSKLAGLLMGSVSHKVSHLSQCTCVTVK